MKTGFVVISISMLFIAGCGLFTGVENNAGDGGDDKAMYSKVLMDAETAFQYVDQSGGAWAYTEDLITEAKQKAAQNKFDEALKLAKEAHDQALAARAQMEGQKKAGPYLF